MLNEITSDMKSVGVKIHPSRVNYEVMKMSEKDGADKIIGSDHFHNNVVDVVQIFTKKEKPVAKNDQ